jgi:hypothetical protein
MASQPSQAELTMDATDNNFSSLDDVSAMGLFDRLSGELRNRIYRFVVGPSHESPGLDTFTASESQWWLISTPPELAGTCHQLRHEVLSVFYGDVVWEFDFTDWSRICKWMEVMGETLRYFRAIRFFLTSSHGYGDGSRKLSYLVLRVSDDARVYVSDKESERVTKWEVRDGEECEVPLYTCPITDALKAVHGREGNDVDWAGVLKALNNLVPRGWIDKGEMCQQCGNRKAQFKCNWRR